MQKVPSSCSGSSNNRLYQLNYLSRLDQLKRLHNIKLKKSAQRNLERNCDFSKKVRNPNFLQNITYRKSGFEIRRKREPPQMGKLMSWL